MRKVRETQSMADHLLSVEVAVDFGVNAALIFHNIANWCEHNRANRKHFFDGRYWTYNSISAFSEIYPYFTEKQIRNAIDKLIEGGLIVKGNYNKLAFDKTTWYALTDKGEAYRSRRANGCDGEGERICPECQTDSPEKSNGFASEGEAIPCVNTFDKRTIGKPTDIDIEAEEESAGACEEVNPYGEGGSRLNTDTIQVYATNQLTVMSPRAMEDLNGFVDDLSEEIVRHAIDNALDQGVRKWAYVKSILNDYVADGVRNVADAAACDERHRKKRKGSGGSGPGFDRSTSEGYVPLGANDRMI